MTLRPFIFKPIIVEALWGREIWVLSSLKGRESHLASSAATVTLPDLVAEFKEQLLGKKIYGKFGTQFPLLVKYIFADDDLSIQVHPNDELAKAKGLPCGKTEMWYVLDAKAGAHLYAGFCKPVSKEEFVERITCSNNRCNKDGCKGIEELLCKIHPVKGDSVFIPAGCIHSIGAGLQILEIQQTADITYRLYDFNRVDKNGNKRRLDIEDGAEAIDFSDSPGKVKNVFNKNSAITLLADCKYFTTVFVNLSEVCRAKSGADNFYHLNLSRLDSFSILIVVGGEGELSFYPQKTSAQDAGEKLPLKTGDVILLPAGLKQVDIHSVKALQFIETHINTKLIKE